MPGRGVAHVDVAAFSDQRGAAVRAAAWQRRAAGSKEYEELSARARAATDELARLAQSGGEREAFHAARAASEEVRQQLAALAREISGGADPTQRVAAEAVAAALAAEDAVVAYRRFVRSSVQAAECSRARLRRTTRLDVHRCLPIP